MTKDVALGLLASKLDRGELEALEAMERAYELGKLPEEDHEPEPPTLRRPEMS